MAQMVKRLSTMRETWVRSLGWEDSLEKEMAIHSSTIAWKIPGQRSLVDYSPWGRKESETTERLHVHGLFEGLPSLVAQMVKRLPAMQETRGSIPRLGRSPGEGNGNPLQYCCLENPMDRGAW